MDGANENARPGDEPGRAQGTQQESKTVHRDFDGNDAQGALGSKPSFGAELRPFLDVGLTPIQLNGKVPVDARWQVRQYDAARVIAAAEGSHNLGLRIPRSLLVVDVDPRNGGDASLERLVRDCGIDLESFPVVRTGGGGLHVYMWLPHDFDAAQSIERYPGIDFKTSGQVVAPGSVHPETGRRYVGERLWLLALNIPAPDAVLSVVKRRKIEAAAAGDRAGEWSPEMLARNLAQLDPDEFVTYDDWLHVMMASHHATAGEGLDEFVEWSTRYTGHDAAAPELIEEKWRGFRADERGVTLQYLCKLLIDRGLPVHDRAEAEDDFDAVEVELTGQPRADRWPIFTLDELDALPPPRWLIEGFLQETTIAAIYGAPESGKSFLAIDMVMSVASDRAWHGHAVSQGAVLYIAAEGAFGLSKRVRAWKVEHGASGPFHLMHSPINLANPKEAAEFSAQVSKRLGQLSMIVIDTLNQTAAGADENSAQDMSRYIDSMKRMRDATGAAVVVIHHSGKDASKGMRGSTALLGAMDTTIEVVRPDEDGMAMHVRVRKQKDAEKEKPIHFEMAKQADSLVLRMTKGSIKQNDAQFAASTVLDWIAAWMDGRESAPFKELIQARKDHLGKGSVGSVRDELKKHIGEGFDNAKTCSDGTRLWLEREAGNPRGALAVHAVRK